MENLCRKIRRLDNFGVTLFALLFMTVGFFQASSLTFGRPIISWVQWPTVGLGCLLVLGRLLNLKSYIRSRGIILLVLFALGYVASSIWTIRYGWYENVRFLVFMVFMFGLLYATNTEEDVQTSRKRLSICAVYYLLGVTLLSLLSFIFMFAGYRKVFYPAVGEEGPIYYIGFWIGRLFGAYWDPNIAATMAALAVLLSLYFFFRTKKVWVHVLCVLSMVLQVFYITFSGSRTGRLCLLVGVLLFTVMMAVKHRFSAKRWLQNTAVVATVVATLACTYYAPTVIQVGSNKVVHLMQQNSINKVDQDKDEKDELSKLPEDIFERGYDTSEDISNRRFDIWGAAVDIFRTSPVLGVSRANILPYVDDNLPDSYLVTNDHMRFESMHNMFFEILASQGALGILFFVSFAIWAIVGILRQWKALWNSEHFLLFVLILAVAAATCTSTLVMAEIVYVTSPIAILFWLSLGCLNHIIVSTKEERV